MVLVKNGIFDPKKGACGKPPAEKNGLFLRERHFWAKKGACGKPPVGGKWFWSFWGKKGACGKPPAEENCFFFPRERHFWAKKKRLRQTASRREKIWAKKSGIRIGDNPIGGGAEKCSNVCLCYRKARNGKKKAPAN